MKAVFVFFCLLIIFNVKAFEIEFESDVESAGERYSTLIDKVCGVWSLFVSVFGKTKILTFKEILKGEGFERLESRATHLFFKGIPKSKFDLIMKPVVNKFSLPEELKSSMLESIQIAKIDPNEDVLSQFDIMFNAKDVSNDKFSFLTFFVHSFDNGKTFDCFASYINANFKLFPNVIVMKETTISFGGAYTKETEVRKEVPAYLTKDELKGIFTFFQLISLKHFVSAFGQGDRISYPKI